MPSTYNNLNIHFNALKKTLYNKIKTELDKLTALSSSCFIFFLYKANIMQISSMIARPFNLLFNFLFAKSILIILSFRRRPTYHKTFFHLHKPLHILLCNGYICKTGTLLISHHDILSNYHISQRFCLYPQ